MTGKRTIIRKNGKTIIGGLKMTNLKTRLRGGFSDRNKIDQISTEIQIIDFDVGTRNKMANLVRHWFDDILDKDVRTHICEKIVNDLFSGYVTSEIEEEIMFSNDSFISSYICDPILSCTFDHVLTIIEYVANKISSLRDEFPDSFDYNCYTYTFHDCTKEINDLFKQEFVGYRMIDKQITPISDEIEVEDVKQSLSNPFDGPRCHIRKALVLLSDREKPDYKNSIKESISAVESVCQIIVNDSKVSLGQAINKLRENGIEIHPAFEEAIKKLYGYTSDKGGIRHAEGVGESNVSFAEAKYMLVTCCAFVNYLVEEYGKIKK